MSQTDNGFLKYRYFTTRGPHISVANLAQRTHYSLQATETRLGSTGVNWLEHDLASGEQEVRTLKVDGQAVKSVTLAIAFDTVASFEQAFWLFFCRMI